jgi:hypothetical protein
VWFLLRLCLYINALFLPKFEIITILWNVFCQFWHKILNGIIEVCFPQRQEDVVALEQVEVTHKPLPPVGALLRPKPRVGDVMYVMKLSYYGVWSRGKVLEVVHKGSEVYVSNQ